MNHSRHQNYKNKRTEMEYLNNIQRNIISRIKNRLLELEFFFQELED